MKSDITEGKVKKGGLNCKPKGERPLPPKGQGTQPTSDNNAMPKCSCGGEIRTVQIKYRCDCGKVFRRV